MRVKKDSKSNDEKILDRFWFVTYVIVTTILFVTAYYFNADHGQAISIYTTLAMIVYIVFPSCGPIARINNFVLSKFSKKNKTDL